MKRFFYTAVGNACKLALIPVLVTAGIGIPQPVSAASYDFDVLVVAGGGGGGASDTSQDEEGAGGGGAGGLREIALSMSEGGHAITIGSGGAGGTDGSAGVDGGDSSISTLLVATGGGAGGGTNDTDGSDGGSAGGGSSRTSGSGTGGSGTAGQGNDAGDGAGTGSGGGGGGGAGAVGTDGDTTDGGAGGNGSSSSISGSSVTYAGGGGGGGGGAGDAGGAGGSGGGGAGGLSLGGAGVAGTAGLGGGGGGGAGDAGDGGNGGSGVVVIRYLTADIAVAVGGVITTDGAYTVHTFTTGGTFTFSLGAAVDPPLLGMSDTLSVSVPASASNHTITFTVPGGVPAGGSFSIDFQDPNTPASVFATGSVGFGDIDVNDGGELTLATCGGQAGATWGVCISGSAIHFQSATDAIALGATVTVQIGTNAAGGTNQLINPPLTSGTQISFDTFDITDTSIGDGATFVAIVSQVTLSATIDDTFVFKVEACESAAGCVVGSFAPEVDSTDTLADFGILTPDDPITMGSSLSVESNALNGFVVTVEQNHDMLASSGADIDAFVDGTPHATGTTWASPAATGGSESTYGHLGLFTEDETGTDQTSATEPTTESDGDWFGLNGTTAYEIWDNDSTGDGFTQDTGHIDVGYRIEVSALQESGVYTNQLMYIATPTF